MSVGTFFRWIAAPLATAALLAAPVAGEAAGIPPDMLQDLPALALPAAAALAGLTVFGLASLARAARTRLAPEPRQSQRVVIRINRRRR